MCTKTGSTTNILEQNCQSWSQLPKLDFVIHFNAWFIRNNTKQWSKNTLNLLVYLPYYYSVDVTIELLVYFQAYSEKSTKGQSENLVQVKSFKI